MSIVSTQIATGEPPPVAKVNRTAVTCYSAFDRFFPVCGLFDLTEGIYHGNPRLPYKQAQANQHNYLLDQVQCQAGVRLLDIGCGYGTLLEKARHRKAVGVGITISPEQVIHCRRNGLEVQLLDYRMLPNWWYRSFDAVIANGSIEHFVQPADIAAGGADDVYHHLFAMVHRLIDPASLIKRFATTTIHFLRKPSDPCALLQNPFNFRWGSDDFHWAILEQGWGGYYPEPEQLCRCAKGCFNLIEEVDGTEDYYLTSEEWLRQVRRALLSSRVLTIFSHSLPVFIHAPRQFLTLLSILLCQSWNWQFRPPNPPTRLLRQTWAYQA